MMSISSKGRYASRIVVFLASLPPGATVTKFEIADAEGISAAYVEQLMLPLRLAGLVASHRGRSGGFSLAKDPESISVGDVLRAVEGTVQVAPCNDAYSCDRTDTCPTRPVWQEATHLLDDLFARTKVADLVRRRQGEDT
jgi:Rrf2 family protein